MTNKILVEFLNRKQKTLSAQVKSFRQQIVEADERIQQQQQKLAVVQAECDQNIVLANAALQKAYYRELEADYAYNQSTLANTIQNRAVEINSFKEKLQELEAVRKELAAIDNIDAAWWQGFIAEQKQFIDGYLV
jgi:hypothetical protein